MSELAPDSQDVQDRLKQITHHIASAHGIVADGNAVNLEGLDAIVNTLCEDIRNLPGSDQDRFKNPLISLIDEFNRLTSALESQRDVLQGELQNLSDRQRATTAYSGAPTANKPK